MPLCWVHKYVQLLDLLQLIPLIIMQCPSLSLVIFFILRSILPDMSYSSFFLLSICMEYIFPSSHFQSVYISKSGVSLLYTAYIWIFFLYPLSHCVLVSTSNPFTFKAIIDVYMCLLALSELCLVYFYSSFPSRVTCL